MYISFVEGKYWYYKKPKEKLFLSFIWKLPRKVIYWAVIRAAVEVEPNKDPSGVTAAQMLDHWGEKH